MGARRRITTAGRWLAGMLVALMLGLCYSVGAFAGGVTLAARMCGAAVRLGWTDVRKRGTHGPA
jgi:hypothetical protein